MVTWRIGLAQGHLVHENPVAPDDASKEALMSRSELVRATSITYSSIRTSLARMVPMLPL